jgi:hypothetical protein
MLCGENRFAFALISPGILAQSSWLVQKHNKAYRPLSNVSVRPKIIEVPVQLFDHDMTRLVIFTMHATAIA